jgi:hypothetical protein
MIFLINIEAVSIGLATKTLCFDCLNQVEQLLHEKIQQLDQQLHQTIILVSRNQEKGIASDSVEDEARMLERRLGDLEREAHRLGPETFITLQGKIDILRDLVGNLKRMTKSGPGSLSLPVLNQLDRTDILHVLQGSGPPPNDGCSNAIVIGDGAAAGSTSDATNDGQASCGGSSTAPDVWFRYIATATGHVIADTIGSSYDTVLSIHSGCPGTTVNQISCNDDAYGLQSAVAFYATAGQEYLIRVSGCSTSSGSYLLNVQAAGAISGVVTQTTTAAPLSRVKVKAYDIGGYWIQTKTTDFMGQFLLGPLTPGSYFIKADAYGGFIDELYDDIACPGGSCSTRSGTAVQVAGNTTTTDINFVLDTGGQITGSLTESTTGYPISSERVVFYNSTGSYVASVYTDSSGSYALGGLTTGTYFMHTDSYEYRDELFDDIPCAPSGCSSPTDGTPIAVTINSTTSDIDFELDRLGAISGSLTDAATGDPISFVSIYVWDDTGSRIGYGYVNSSGSYTVAALPAGTYFVTTGTNLYFDELYDDVACPEGCDVTTGTPVVVSLNATTSGIDFALNRLGAISGSLTEAVTGDPISYAKVRIWDDTGSRIGYVCTDSSGSYTVTGLATGTYYLTTNTNLYFDELYDDVSCPEGCDVTTGTPVAVTLATTTSGIDFELDRLGTISGTLTEAAGGDPIPYASVDVWDDTGSWIEYGYSDSSGIYTFAGLATGTYFVTTDTNLYNDELYDDVSCPEGCDVTTGTPVVVTLNTTTSGIDFALDRLGAISGTLTEAAGGDPISYASVIIWDDTGSRISSRNVDSSGSYSVAGLASGTYFVTTNANLYFDKLYDDISCPEGCDVTTGTPVVVSLNTTTSDIDFALDRLGAISGTLTNAATGEPIAYANVDVWDDTGSWIDDGYADSSGSYTVAGLATGTYFVTSDTYDAYHYLDELYDSIPCAQGCVVTSGTPVMVTLNTTTSGIDFALFRPGAIAGTVTVATSGAPLPSVEVTIWDAAGNYVGEDSTDSTGSYEVEGLLDGIYFATCDPLLGYISELYDSIPCPGGPPYGCVPTTGTPISVDLNTTTAGIDFILDTYGVIAGTVTEAESGDPLENIEVMIWSDSGDYVAYGLSDATGFYSVTGLVGGTYYATTEDFYHSIFLSELYFDRPCHGGGFSCNPMSGTPINVSLSSTTSGIDFTLTDQYELFRDGFETGDTTLWSNTVN